MKFNDSFFQSGHFHQTIFEFYCLYTNSRRWFLDSPCPNALVDAIGVDPYTFFGNLHMVGNVGSDRADCDPCSFCPWNSFAPGEWYSEDMLLFFFLSHGFHLCSSFEFGAAPGMPLWVSGEPSVGSHHHPGGYSAISFCGLNEP